MNLNAADPGNRATQPHQFVTVQFVCPAKVMDDLGDGTTRFGMPHIVGKLIVLDHRSIRIFAFCSS
jgi:hypothetical protein